MVISVKIQNFSRSRMTNSETVEISCFSRQYVSGAVIWFVRDM